MIDEPALRLWASAALASGSVAISAPSTTVSATVTGLVASTAFDVWYVAQDDEGTPNVQASPVRVDTATGVDVTAPTFVSGYPATASVVDTSFDVTVQLNEAGSFFYVVVPSGASQPTAAQVVLGLSSSGGVPVASGSGLVTSAATTVTSTASGLTHSTAYDVWAVGRDDEATPNTQSSATKVSVTTGADVSPPTFVSGFPRSSAVSDGGFTVDVQLSESGDFFMVVVPNGASAPSVAQVKAGTTASGSAALASATTVGGSPSTVLALSVTGLAAATAYDAYIVAQDGESPANVQASVVRVDVSTSVDVTAPTFVSGFPRAAGISDFSFNIESQLNEAGAVFVVVVILVETQPS